jgi:hypothetical protein
MLVLNKRKLGFSANTVVNVRPREPTTLDGTGELSAVPLHWERPVRPYWAHKLDSVSDVQERVDGAQAS